RHTRFSRDWSSDVCSSDLRHPTERPGKFVHFLPGARRDDPSDRSVACNRYLPLNEYVARPIKEARAHSSHRLRIARMLEPAVARLYHSWVSYGKPSTDV